MLYYRSPSCETLTDVHEDDWVCCCKADCLRQMSSMAGSLSHGKHTCFDVRFLHAEADAAERLASVDRSNQHYSWLKRLKNKRLHSWDYLLCLIFVDLTLT